MTRQEALDILTDNRVFTHACESTEEEQGQALDIAIKSLRAWDTVIVFLGKYRDLYSKYDSAIRVKTIEDCIAIILAGLEGVEE